MQLKLYEAHRKPLVRVSPSQEEEVSPSRSSKRGSAGTQESHRLGASERSKTWPTGWKAMRSSLSTSWSKTALTNYYLNRLGKTWKSCYCHGLDSVWFCPSFRSWSGQTERFHCLQEVGVSLTKSLNSRANSSLAVQAGPFGGSRKGQLDGFPRQVESHACRDLCIYAVYAHVLVCLINTLEVIQHNRGSFRPSGCLSCHVCCPPKMCPRTWTTHKKFLACCNGSK